MSVECHPGTKKFFFKFMSAGNKSVKRKSGSTKNSLKQSRADLFESYFAEIYGDRWPRLRAALITDPRQEVLVNPFGGGLQDYRLDAASVVAARQLDVSADHRIADFCASPGGKSLVLIFALRDGDFHLNDLSPGRVQRLKAVLHDCLPPRMLAKMTVTKSDASRWGMARPEEFDRILVDAPCSGERHLLQSPRELDRWSLKGAKGLSVRQHALACSALDALKPGGRMVYSTCSIHPLENDGVIDRLKKSRPNQFRILTPNAPMGEPTSNGWLILPDVTGCGPIYFSILEKV